MKKNTLTGYPHIDNVHKAYFGEKGKEQIDVNKTMYQYLYTAMMKEDRNAMRNEFENEESLGSGKRSAGGSHIYK
jgi:hypothetical protein